MSNHLTYQIRKANRTIKGKLTLDGSKSISNRVLIIRALCDEDFPINYLSTSRDTETLNELLQTKEAIFDAGAAGTTFRFMTAFLALQKGTQVLTGSERMKQRPIAVLVDALRQLGASIDYLEKEGYPPLKINAPTSFGASNKLTIAANVSSQYISALLMIAPTLPNGLALHLDGKIVSRPYIEMTLRLMEYFGVEHEWNGNDITIIPQKYQAKAFDVEADWSAASYYYAMAAFADELDLYLDGLGQLQLQGDAVLTEMMNHFGVQTTFTKTGIHLTKTKLSKEKFEWDFIRCPDIAQTLAVVCAGKGVEGIFTGLETLRIKETDRILALQNELAKVQCTFNAIDHKNDKEFFSVNGIAKLTQPIFPTYEDHRMAMAFAPLSMLGTIQIEEPKVVGKSYPNFWKDIQTLGFEIEEI